MTHRHTAATAALILGLFAPHAGAQQLASLAPAQLATSPVAAAGGEDAALSRVAVAVDSIARRAMHDQSIPGLSVAIVKDGKVLLERGWGTQDGRNQATGNSVYQIASVSKQFTAAAILRLAEHGQLSLDDDVTRYVDGLPDSYRGISLRQLLNHTAGVPNFTEFFREYRQVLTPAQLVDSLATRPLQFAPGHGFHYSNSGYYLLGLVIERVTGQAYDEYLRAQFFGPLGMYDTEYCGDSGLPVPAGYMRSRRGEPVRTTPWDPSILFAAGSLCSSASDLARWEVALGEGKVLKPESYREMTTPSINPDASLRMSYGFGMMVDSTGDAGPYLHHDGAVAGFRSQVAWYPAEHLAVVVLMNQGLATPEPIERDFTRAVLGATPRPATQMADRPQPRMTVPQAAGSTFDPAMTVKR